MKRLALLALLIAGCATTAPQVGSPPPQVESDAAEALYQKTVARYSDHQEIYAGFDTVLFGATTFQSLPFREARVRRQARFQEWPQAKLSAALDEEKAQATEAIEFLLGVHVNDYHYDDFDRRDSIWRIALATPAGEVTPISIERVGRADLNLRAYYPYMGDFWVAYRIRFPQTLANGTPMISDATQKLVLRIASSLGHAEFQVAAH